MADETVEKTAGEPATTTTSEIPMSPPAEAAPPETAAEATPPDTEQPPENETPEQKKTREGWDAKRAEANEKAAAARREADAEKIKREALEKTNAQLLELLAKGGKPPEAQAAEAPDELETIRKEDAEQRKLEQEAIKSADFDKLAEIRAKRDELSDRKDTLIQTRHRDEIKGIGAKAEKLDAETQRRQNWEAEVKASGVKIEDADTARNAAWAYARGRGHKPGSAEERAAAQTHYDIAFDSLKKSSKTTPPARKPTAPPTPGSAPGSGPVPVISGAGPEEKSFREAFSPLADQLFGNMGRR